MRNLNILDYCKKNNIKWAFFDCFDTLIHRTITEEEPIHKWSIKMIEYLPLELRVPLIRARFDVINIFHQEANFNYNYEEIMSSVYDRLVYIQNPSFSLDKKRFIELAFEKEIQTNCDFCVIDRENVALLHELSALCVKIAVVSDFYIGAKGIRKILGSKKELSLLDKVFVSCDYRSRKADGDLYRVVLDRLNVDGRRCVMIGDNVVSDVKRARKFQIRPFHRPYKSEVVSLEGALEHIYERNCIDEIAGLHYSYSLSLFFLRLLNRLRETKQKDVFFLAREGEFLKKAFDRYLYINNCESIRTHYLYVSRKATLMPSLDSLDKEGFKRIFRQTTALSVETFLKALNFPLDARKEIFSCLHDIDCKKVHPHFDQHMVFFDLCKQRKFRKLYEEQRKSTREALISYIKTFGVDFAHFELALVDVGWKGTIQDNLYHVFNGMVKIRGFYMGLTGLGDIQINNMKEGLLFSVAPVKSKEYGTWLNREFYERFMRASHGMTLCYRMNESGGYPVLEEINTENEAYHFVRPTQEKLLAILLSIERLFQFYEADESERSKLLLSLHKHFVLHLGKKDIIFERRLFDLNKESFIGSERDGDLKNTLFKVLQNVKHIMKEFFSIEFYNGPFRAYRYPMYFFMLWGRCIYWKQRIRGELK